MARERQVALGPISTLDQSSLEQFQTELIKARFRSVDDEFQRVWVGPVPDGFGTITDATQMRLEFQDGWPFRPPKVFVPGIELEHVNPEGEVCLWRPDDPSLQWTTFEGLNNRIREWCSAAEGGFRPEDAALDAHLYFERGQATRTLVTFDLGTLSPSGFSDRRDGALHGLRKHSGLIEVTGGPGPSESVPGRWYYRATIPVPPHDIETFKNKLGRSQLRDFDELCESVESRPVGSERLALLIWNADLKENALPLLLRREEEGVVAQPLIAAPTDIRTLSLRSGPDFPTLRTKRVALFGAGAIGSHVALLLSECGLGHLIIIDCDVLRPGNVVRHMADRRLIGYPKADIVKILVQASAPWTSVESKGACPWTLDDLSSLTKDIHLVVDATGYWSFAQHVSAYFRQSNVPLVSAALYRGGAVARIRRQVLETDAVICERVENPAYPIIPPDDQGGFTLEIGCSSPVHNASPAAVAAAAALTAQVAIDALTERFRYGDEVLDVYSVLESPPFDKLGRIEFGQ